MIPTQNLKFFNVTPPAAAVNNASLTTNVIDTQGADYVDVVVILGATDIALTALKLQEADAASDATTLTAGADVAGAVFGTSNGIGGIASVLPSATDDNKIYVISVDCRARKRFLKPVVTIGNGAAGAFATVLAILSRLEVAPTTAAGQGAGQILRA